jgi:nucleoside-diphosphate-sugar epimerase
MSTSTTAEGDYVPHNILLTGGCGFIGSHVCKFLVCTHLELDLLLAYAKTLNKFF